MTNHLVEPRPRGDRDTVGFRATIPSGSRLVRAEAGYIEYSATTDMQTTLPVQDGPRPDVVTVVEKWATLDALYAHTKAPHMTEYRTTVKDFVQGVSLQVMDTATPWRRFASVWGVS